MSLKHILLGLLDEPRSGYDIKKEFDENLRNCWRAELSQIYPTLQKLADDGLLISKSSPSDIGPTRRIYARTKRGDKELRAWLAEGPLIGTERLAYLAQVYLLAQLPDDTDKVAFLERLRDYMASWLEQLESAEAAWKAADPGYPDELPEPHFYQQMSLQLGLERVRINLEWCDESIARMRRRYGIERTSRRGQTRA